MSRVTLRERFFPLHQSTDVDRFLGGFPWCVVFKAGTSEKTFDAWLVAQHALEPRADVAVGFINSLFENPWGCDVKAARLIALEFQGQLAGRLEPLKARAARMLERLRDR